MLSKNSDSSNPVSDPNQQPKVFATVPALCRANLMTRQHGADEAAEQFKFLADMAPPPLQSLNLLLGKTFSYFMVNLF